MKKPDRRFPLIAMVGASCLAASAAASAAEAPPDEGIEEVIVTATKQAVELSKVPISVSAYTQAMMDDRAIHSINDIVAQTPGIDLGDQGSNGTGDRISVRGIDSNSGAATTGVYIDDTPLQSRSNPVNLAGTVFPEVFDLERVEVLRGPQGTLFGAGAEGGVVRFITPTPSLNKDSAYARAEVSITAHGDPSYEGGAAFGGPIKDGVLGIRVSGWGRRTGGFVDRTSWQSGATDQRADWSEAGGARAALLWQAGENWQVTPSILYQGSHSNDTGDFWSSLSKPSSGRFVNGYAARQQSTEHFALPGLKITGDLGAVQFNSITSFFYRAEGNVSDVTNYDIAGNYFNDGVNPPLGLGAVGINGEDNFFPTLASGAPVTDLFIGTTTQNIFTQEFRFQSTDAKAPVRWVAGLYFQNSRLNDTQVAPNPQLVNLYNQQQGAGAFDAYYYDTTICTGPCTGLLNGTVEYQGNEHSRDMGLAAFGNVDWSITQRLVLNAGLRVEKTKSNFVAVEDGPVNNGPSVGGGSANATPVTPKLGLSFQQDDDTLYYGSVAKGYRPGGGNSHIPQACSQDISNIGLTEAPSQYDSDYTWSYELGSKQKLAGGKVSVAASAYYIDWRNVQWYYFLPSCGYGIVFNLGHVKSTGFDFELNAKLTPDLLATVAIGYTDAKFQETVDKGGAPVVFQGQTLGQAPWTVYGSLEYRFALGEAEGWYGRLTDDYKGSGGKYLYQYAASAVADSALQPGGSINRLDLRLGRRWQGLDLSLFVANALDAAPLIVNPQSSHYVGSDFNTGDPVSSPIFSYSTIRPRTIGLTLLYNY
jgi:outer membrane receptor protein involved in Fe transport